MTSLTFVPFEERADHGSTSPLSSVDFTKASREIIIVPRAGISPESAAGQLATCFASTEILGFAAQATQAGVKIVVPAAECGFAWNELLRMSEIVESVNGLPVRVTRGQSVTATTAQPH